jgi:hypothetical protein
MDTASWKDFGRFVQGIERRRELSVALVVVNIADLSPQQ